MLACYVYLVAGMFISYKQKTAYEMRISYCSSPVCSSDPIFNDAWHENWCFVPFTESEVEAMSRDLRLLIYPRLVFFVELDGEPVAFGVCLPNVNEAIRDLGGRLLPFGWAKLLWRLKVRQIGRAHV